MLAPQQCACSKPAFLLLPYCCPAAELRPAQRGRGAVQRKHAFPRHPPGFPRLKQQCLKASCSGRRAMLEVPALQTLLTTRDYGTSCEVLAASKQKNRQAICLLAARL